MPCEKPGLPTRKPSTASVERTRNAAPTPLKQWSPMESGEAFPDEFGEDTAVVDVFAAATADVHQREVFGAGDVHVGQGPGGPAGGFIGVQDRRGGQQVLHVRQE